MEPKIKSKEAEKNDPAESAKSKVGTMNNKAKADQAYTVAPSQTS